MKIRVIGNDPSYTKTYEGEALTYELKSGFLHILDSGGNRIGTHNQNTWATAYYFED